MKATIRDLEIHNESQNAPSHISMPGIAARVPPGRIVPPAPPGWSSWEDLMDRALVLADAARILGEVPVGALVVSPDGRIVGEGYNTPERSLDATAHAEISAIRAACATLGNYRLNGCTLIVTLEPCLMCAGAMVHARIAGVVYGAADSLAGAVSSRLEGLEASFLNHTVWHMGGIRERECARILRDFFGQKRNGRG